MTRKRLKIEKLYECLQSAGKWNPSLYPLANQVIFSFLPLFLLTFIDASGESVDIPTSINKVPSTIVHGIYKILGYIYSRAKGPRENF